MSTLYSAVGFTLTLRLGNDAMLDAMDVADALRSAAGWLEEYAVMSPGESGSLLDQNGNRVGGWTVY